MYKNHIFFYNHRQTQIQSLTKTNISQNPYSNQKINDFESQTFHCLGREIILKTFMFTSQIFSVTKQKVSISKVLNGVSSNQQIYI